MTWAFKRKFFYLGIIAVFVLGFIFMLIYPSFNKAPTCYDRKQNGVETGVDCGGICARVCPAEVDKISILWSRVFKIVDGRYNAVAYLENHNKNTIINKIKYKFRFADKDNLYIGKREGETYVPPSGKFAVFEEAISLGEAVPVYTTFEFTEAPLWVKVDENKINQVRVFVSDINLENETTNPRLSAIIKNDSFFQVPDIDIVAILYDEEGNAISASSTYVPILKQEEKQEIYFTWREGFTEKVFVKEIIPIFNVLQAVMK